MYYHIMQSPLGDIALTANEHGLTALSFLAGEGPLQITGDMQENPALFQDVVTQLEQYFAGTRSEFEVKLAPPGTAFQQKVWQALTEIPFGESRSYLWLAQHIGNEKAVRAVGGANGANPIAIIIPCHRVIGANGKLTGYAGGLEFKEKLLLHEGASFRV